MNFAETKIEGIRKHLRRIMPSSLKLSQKINAVKTFVIPQLDFYLMNGQTRVKDLQEVDVEIRRIINETLKGPRLPIDYYYTNWKDGGASMICLEERKEVMTISNLAHLLCSKDPATRDWMMSDINEEVRKRKIETTDYRQRFLNWIEDDKHQLQADGRRFDSLIIRAYRASRKLQIGVHYIEETTQFLIENFQRSDEDEAEEGVEQIQPNKFLAPAKQVASLLMRILQSRHRDNLQSLALRGHSFDSLQNSRYSNFFIGNCKAPTSDALVKFVVRARTNSLPTKAILLKAGKVQDDHCSKCRKPESLSHILNGCRSRFQHMTFRHNSVCKVLVQAILKHFKRPIVKPNSTIRLPGREHELPEDSRILKPDIWFEKDGVIHLIEVTVPYWKLTENNPKEEEEL
jgi:hypothetical protein